MTAAANALKIQVHDHLVIGRGKHTSFKALDCCDCVRG